MSGHSKWSTIKRKKGKADAARGRIFTKLIREITVAAKMGGGDIESNPRLRVAVNAAKAANMPSDNMNRAIKKGTGELPGTVYEEVTYEGYGPGGCAILIDSLTDNKMRTLSEVRHGFTKHGGSLANDNAVAYLFDRISQIVVDPGEKDEDDVMEVALDAGAEDIVTEDDGMVTVTGQPNDLETIREALETAEFKIESAEVTMVAQNNVVVTDEQKARAMIKMMEVFDENDDIQKIYSNFDIDQELMEKLSAE